MLHVGWCRHHCTTLFTEITMRESNNTPENGSKTVPKRIKELIDTYYPEIAERLRNGKRNGK